MGYTRSLSPLYHRLAWTRSFAYVAVSAFLLLCLLFGPLPRAIEDPRNKIIRLPSLFKESVFETKAGRVSNLATNATHAYATFLADDSVNQAGGDINDDKYFVATRILAYQLLHASETKTGQNLPLVVLVNKGVSEAKRQRLRQDGAIVWEPKPVNPRWIRTEVSTWQSVLTKLRLWELTQFERICFLDADTVLTRSLDGIFTDPATTSRAKLEQANAIRGDEKAQPDEYVFAGVPEMNQIHHYPPTEEGHDFPNMGYFNAGFFVLRPSRKMLDYYLSLTKTPGRFEPLLPEQNLLNYAHRPEGNMPWQHLDTGWNMHYPNMQDVQGGVASLHEKWWAPVSSDLTVYLATWRWRMEAFHEARDADAAQRTT